MHKRTGVTLFCFVYKPLAAHLHISVDGSVLVRSTLKWLRDSAKARIGISYGAWKMGQLGAI